MPQPNDLSRSLAALDQDSTLIAVIEMSQASWLVGASVPGVERHPLKKLVPDAAALLRLTPWPNCATTWPRLQLVKEQIADLERARLQRLRHPPADAAQAQLAILTRVVGLGIETADVVVHELLMRNLRDRRAVARYGGITGAPDESGARRRQKGLARAGNARVRRAMLQLAWRFLMFQKQSALVEWFRARTADGRITTRKTMILALARKLLIALWRLATTGEVPQGVVLRPAA